ncbi:uncharacterized protein PHACADRAFT_260672 [Phanerochaete carnosa HHB-10118-sp]|uniref:PPIase cyclophilin-type domain-containing protein n=1 Tax=Phanerochaete carnosa (strain HHB-10118-sp) TaxID=650164 RepID=K5VLR7_PHACS|nr:uncharacterized protein PHACADRAFT_260672 [Phanerochaete carnosa HHB-10118-sp]EKM52343.1 hypothetical protein PHACADRAFT_260672 [Phanerochaete carnosa HHB-10118-sp]
MLFAFTAASLAIGVAAVAAQGGGNASFVDPTTQGGSFFLMATDGLGEPLNVVISGLSSPEVLTDTGFLNYARAVGFTTECFSLTLGTLFTANLGDGNGPQNQTMELRESFGNAMFGACIEMFLGGNHLRMFRQDGPQANTSALFLATSAEEGLFQNHTISADGYDVGRNIFANMAAGMTQFNGTSYNTTVQNLTGVLPVGSQGVNHGIAIDGNAFLLTVTTV